MGRVVVVLEGREDIRGSSQQAVEELGEKWRLFWNPCLFRSFGTLDDFDVCPIDHNRLPVSV